MKENTQDEDQIHTDVLLRLGYISAALCYTPLFVEVFKKFKTAKKINRIVC